MKMLHSIISASNAAIKRLWCSRKAPHISAGKWKFLFYIEHHNGIGLCAVGESFYVLHGIEHWINPLLTEERFLLFISRKAFHIQTSVGLCIRCIVCVFKVISEQLFTNQAEGTIRTRELYHQLLCSTYFRVYHEFHSIFVINDKTSSHVWVDYVHDRSITYRFHHDADDGYENRSTILKILGWNDWRAYCLSTRWCRNVWISFWQCEKCMRDLMKINETSSRVSGSH